MPEKKSNKFWILFFVGLGLGLTALILFFVFNSKKKCKQITDCKQGETCNLNNGECISCPSSCSDGKNCGLDDNGCLCGNCDQGEICKDGKCITCTPKDCSNLKCNIDNGCGSPCGCTKFGQKCNQEGECENCATTNCVGKQCGFDENGCSCGTCPQGTICTYDGSCQKPCIPTCNNKCDGSSDGCDGHCTVCPQGTTCTDDGSCQKPPPPIIPGSYILQNTRTTGCVTDVGGGGIDSVKANRGIEYCDPNDKDFTGKSSWKKIEVQNKPGYYVLQNDLTSGCLLHPVGTSNGPIESRLDDVYCNSENANFSGQSSWKLIEHTSIPGDYVLQNDLSKGCMCSGVIDEYSVLDIPKTEYCDPESETYGTLWKLIPVK